MKLSELKIHLHNLSSIGFQLPDGNMVDNHFHVTEVGKITKHFIDCGGTERNEEVVSLQLWKSVDYDHRLHPEKLLGILELSERKLGIGDLDIEVEYQGDTIGKYGLNFDGKNFLLTTKQTACLATDACGIPEYALDRKLTILQPLTKNTACTPGTGCC